MDPQVPENQAPLPQDPVQKPETYSPFSPLMIISMAVFILGCLGVVIFLYFQNQQLKSMLARYQTQSASPTPFPESPPADPTANWKTYSDAKNVFSFKYPSSLQLKTFSDGSLILTATDGSDKIIHEFRVNQYLIPSGITLYQFIYEDGVGGNYGKSYLNGNNVSLTFKNVSQNSLYKVWEPSQWPSGNGIFINFIQNSNHLIWFSLEPYNPGGTPIPYEKENLQIYNQILSTFQFTNITSSVSPSATAKACTQEAKLCPNGSYVGRTGPNCDFTPCPTP